MQERKVESDNEKKRQCPKSVWEPRNSGYKLRPPVAIASEHKLFYASYVGRPLFLKHQRKVLFLPTVFVHEVELWPAREGYFLYIPESATAYASEIFSMIQQAWGEYPKIK